MVARLGRSKRSSGPWRLTNPSRRTVSAVGWSSLISAADAGAIGLDTSRRAMGDRVVHSKYSNRTTGPRAMQWRLPAVRSRCANGSTLPACGTGRNCGSISTANCRKRAPGVDYCTQLSLAPMFLGADPDSLYLQRDRSGILARPTAQCASRAPLSTRIRSRRPERLEKTPGTIGLYDFTIDTGRYAIDRSGHGNHGIIIGAKYAKDGIQDLAPVEAKESK